MLFTGQYEHTIDAKHRLAIPSDIRARWSPKQHGEAWYAVPWKQGLIRLYTEKDFEEAASHDVPTLTPDEDQAELQAILFGNAARLEEDSAGRVRIPDQTLELVSMPSEVILVGAKHWIDIRDRAAWKSAQASNLARLPGLIERMTHKSAPRTDHTDPT